MGEKMVVTKALDERDLLTKKIAKKTEDAKFVDIVKPNEDKVMMTRLSREEFSGDAERSYQQVMDLIDRYIRLDAAIVASNANTIIRTSYGEMTVAAAINLRNRLKGSGGFEGKKDFETVLMNKMEIEYKEKLLIADGKNEALEETAEEMRLSILGKEVRAKEEKPLGVVEEYVRENKAELVDPIDIRKKIEALKDKRNTLLSELDTQIKISNATTFIEF